ncbi:hypothetical protein TYRP_010579 [Tyrophagus putrescentiae]|nr:hypothetical protein TYRP_010579 [Tyrophagus putrescentiae]
MFCTGMGIHPASGGSPAILSKGDEQCRVCWKLAIPQRERRLELAIYQCKVCKHPITRIFINYSICHFGALSRTKKPLFSWRTSAITELVEFYQCPSSTSASARYPLCTVLLLPLLLPIPYGFAQRRLVTFACVRESPYLLLDRLLRNRRSIVVQLNQRLALIDS